MIFLIINAESYNLSAFMVQFNNLIWWKCNILSYDDIINHVKYKFA